MTIKKETALKILDFIDAIRREEDKECMGGESVEMRYLCAEVAKMAGFKTRAVWTDLLLADKSTAYYKASEKDGIAFHP